MYRPAQLTLKRDSIELWRVAPAPNQSPSGASPEPPPWERLDQSEPRGDEQVALWRESAYTSARAARDRSLAEQLHSRQCGGRQGLVIRCYKSWVQSTSLLRRPPPRSLFSVRDAAAHSCSDLLKKQPGERHRLFLREKKKQPKTFFRLFSLFLRLFFLPLFFV